MTARVRGIAATLGDSGRGRGRKGRRPTASPIASSRSGWPRRGRAEGGAMKARIAGAELAYDVRGSGPAVLLLHAFPLGLAHVGRRRPARLPAPFQVVRFDARGFGGSPPGDGLLTMERIADDARRAPRSPADRGGHGVRALHGRLCRLCVRAQPSRRGCAAWSSPTPRRPRTATRRARPRRAGGQGAQGRDGGHRGRRPAQAPREDDATSSARRSWPACASSSWPIPRAGSPTRWPAWPRARTRRPPCARSACPRSCVRRGRRHHAPAEAEALHAGIKGSRWS